jgi:hypothetical protein
MTMVYALLEPTVSGDGVGVTTLEVTVTVESDGNFEDYIRFLFYHVFGPVNHGQNWKGWERSGEKS